METKLFTKETNVTNIKQLKELTLAKVPVNGPSDSYYLTDVKNFFDQLNIKYKELIEFSNVTESTDSLSCYLFFEFNNKRFYTKFVGGYDQFVLWNDDDNFYNHYDEQIIDDIISNNLKAFNESKQTGNCIKHSIFS